MDSPVAFSFASLADLAFPVLSFAKTPQGLDSGSRNNVTGHSACYSFQPRFEILTRNRQEGGRYVIDFKADQNFGEPQVYDVARV